MFLLMTHIRHNSTWVNSKTPSIGCTLLLKCFEQLPIRVLQLALVTHPIHCTQPASIQHTPTLHRRVGGMLVQLQTRCRHGFIKLQTGFLPSCTIFKILGSLQVLLLQSLASQNLSKYRKQSRQTSCQTQFGAVTIKSTCKRF